MYGQLLRKFRRSSKTFSCYLQEEDNFDTFAPIGCHVKEKKKKYLKKWKMVFLRLKACDPMAQGKQRLKFRYRDNYDTDGRQKTEEFRFYGLC